jgi:hypothetical protein
VQVSELCGGLMMSCDTCIDPWHNRHSELRRRRDVCGDGSQAESLPQRGIHSVSSPVYN